MPAPARAGAPVASGGALGPARCCLPCGLRCLVYRALLLLALALLVLNVQRLPDPERRADPLPAARLEAAANVPPGKPAAVGPPPEAPADWPPSQWAEREAGLRLLPVADGAGVDEELRRLEAVRRQAERAERLLADAEAQVRSSQEDLREALRLRAARGPHREERCLAASWAPECSFLTKDVIETLGGGNFSGMGDCALVGSAEHMIGSGFGPAIDAHDTVIRVNRLPNQSHAMDFGSKTSVYFTGHIKEKKVTYSETGIAAQYIGGATEACTVATGVGCPFASLVFNKPLHREARIVVDFWNGSIFPWGQAAWEAQQGAVDIFQQRWNYARKPNRTDFLEPTSGFTAIVLFVPICERLTLYGFGGSGTADGHALHAVKHDIEKEHVLTKEFVDGRFMNEGRPKLDRFPSESLLQCVFTKSQAGCIRHVKPAGM